MIESLGKCESVSMFGGVPQENNAVVAKRENNRWRTGTWARAGRAIDQVATCIGLRSKGAHGVRL